MFNVLVFGVVFFFLSLFIIRCVLVCRIEQMSLHRPHLEELLPRQVEHRDSFREGSLSHDLSPSHRK